MTKTGRLTEKECLNNERKNHSTELYSTFYDDLYEKRIRERMENYFTVYLKLTQHCKSTVLQES